MKEYSTPVVEKIVFDYTVQTTASTCIQQITNVKTSDSECGDGTPNIKWVRDEDPDW